MKELLKGNRGRSTYIIAEIGHAHRGNVNLALELIERCAEGGADAVKFQKRDPRTLFTSKFFNSPYESKYSFGRTYGIHREFLEPTLEMLEKANAKAHEYKLDFIVTPFDIASLTFCERYLTVDAYKIASGDITNHILIEEIASKRKPLFCSCGAASLNEVDMAVKILKTNSGHFVLMYTYSEYPLKREHIFLGSIPFLKSRYELENIGYSCHSPDILVPRMAIDAGALFIEKHIKSDQSFQLNDDFHSILPEDLYLLRQPISVLPEFSGISWSGSMEINMGEMESRYKMGKSLYYKANLSKGTTISVDHLISLSPATGLPPYYLYQLLGKKLLKDVEEEQAVQVDDFSSSN